MANDQIVRWLENEDTSLIDFRRFNLSPEDVYPDITMCFTGHELYWYNDESIFRKFGVSTATYANMLKGGEGFGYRYNYSSKLYTKFEIENKSLLLEDAENFQLGLSNIFTSSRNKFTVTRGDSNTVSRTRQIPAHVSFKTPDTICFTRASNDDIGTLRVYDLAGLNRTIFGNKKYSNVEFKIFFHHPQQLIRSFHRYAFKSKMGYMQDPKDGSNKSWTKLLRIAISKVTVLRKRPTSNVPCDLELKNDDEKLQREIMKHIKCIPIYWKHNVGSNLDLKICNSSEYLKKAYHYIENHKIIFGTYHPPCFSSEVVTKYDKEEENESEDPTIQILYRETIYQVILNTESFNFKSCVSGVGGFAGIFLGYSILQSLDLISILFGFFKKFRDIYNGGMLKILK